MTAPRWSATLLALTLPFLPAATAGANAPPADGAAGKVVDRVELPDGWQPEAITTDRERLYVGSLAPSATPRFLNDLVVTRKASSRRTPRTRSSRSCRSARTDHCDPHPARRTGTPACRGSSRAGDDAYALGSRRAHRQSPALDDGDPLRARRR